MNVHSSSSAEIHTTHGVYTYHPLDQIPGASEEQIRRLPVSIRIMLEMLLRKFSVGEVTQQTLNNLLNWQSRAVDRPILPFYPGRVLMQDFSGVPVLVDLAAMRSAAARRNANPALINPVIPVDVVIDHSIQVDYFGIPDAILRNTALEFERNRERYEFLHWGQKVFKNFRVVPPSTGIIHQVNLEYLSPVVLSPEGNSVAFPDTVVGTDSHTTMINGLGVIGWGVGGIEAVAAMLGQPIEMSAPDVIGFKLSGALCEGVTPTDLTLTITQMLRKRGVVEKFVEFFGPGLSTLPVTDRAMIANMAPENGATVMYFPVDQLTLDYLRFTGRPRAVVELVEAYYRAQGLFREDQFIQPEYTDVIELDLSTVEPSMAGPKRPQDRVTLSQMKNAFRQALTAPRSERGYSLHPERMEQTAVLEKPNSLETLTHGSVVIAAITSCTNTSNPTVMVAAGLLAKKAIEKGLHVPGYVKTSMAPGSRVVTDYLTHAGLLEPLGKLGFHVVGYGCTTCIGNSGPLPEDVSQAISESNLVVASVLSGNRNFEGRVHPNAQANYLASPPLVVAYALAGTVDIDLTTEPMGMSPDGTPVYLRDIWPTSNEVMDVIAEHLTPDMFRERYEDVFTGNETWNNIHSTEDLLHPWDPASTYIQEPPYFLQSPVDESRVSNIYSARALLVLGDSITTDHISPAGSIAITSPAGRYLVEQNVQPRDFNSYGSRRGNDRVMTRGTFANIRIKNLLLPGIEGSYTLHLPDGEQTSVYEAAMKYQQEGVPLVVLAGKEYGSGSSRDWAAKGALLLGVRAVIAESFERIHRSNLAEMGVLPLQFMPGDSIASLGLTGHEVFSIEGLENGVSVHQQLIVRADREDGSAIQFRVISRLDTPIELEYFRKGGILPYMLDDLVR